MIDRFFDTFRCCLQVAQESILETLTADDIRILVESIDEEQRRGSFTRVFPTPNSRKYLRYFEVPRYYNLLLDAWCRRYSRSDSRNAGEYANGCHCSVLNLVLLFNESRVTHSDVWWYVSVYAFSWTRFGRTLGLRAFVLDLFERSFLQLKQV